MKCHRAPSCPVANQDIFRYNKANLTDSNKIVSLFSLFTFPVAPRVDEMPSSAFLPRGKPGRIPCPVKANPAVFEVDWFKDNYRIQVSLYSIIYSTVLVRDNYSLCLPKFVVFSLVEWKGLQSD